MMKGISYRLVLFIWGGVEIERVLSKIIKSSSWGCGANCPMPPPLSTFRVVGSVFIRNLIFFQLWNDLIDHLEISANLQNPVATLATYTLQIYYRLSSVKMPSWGVKKIQTWPLHVFFFLLPLPVKKPKKKWNNR